MTQLEYIEKNAELSKKQREARMEHCNKLEEIDRKHAERVKSEQERYIIERRREQAEYAEKSNQLIDMMTELKTARAITRAIEENAQIEN